MKLVRLFIVFAKYNLKRELEFRLNTFLSLLIYLGWFGLTLISIELIFGQVKAVANWNREEIYILSSIFLLFLSVTKTVYHQSLGQFTDAVRTGYFDFWLLKPTPTRLIASINRFEWLQMIRAVIAFATLLFLLKRFSFSPSLGNWGQFTIIIISGYLALYSLAFISAASAFWFINLFNLSDLWDELYDLGRMPTQIYKGFLEPVLFIVIPAALTATLPTQALLGKLDRIWLGIGPLTAVALLLISQGFWRFALSRYASASS